MVARINIVSNAKELEMRSAIIFLRLEAATKRLASGDSFVNKPTFPALEALIGLESRTGLFLTLAVATFCTRLGASGVTDAGVLGSPLTSPFLAGPGRFNLTF